MVKIRFRRSLSEPLGLRSLIPCARVVLALLRRGIANVFVFDGGLNAWKRRAGFYDAAAAVGKDLLRVWSDAPTALLAR